MIYPLIFSNQNIEIYPLFSNQLEGDPYIFNFSSSNPETLEYDTTNFDNFQKRIFSELSRNNKTWGIGKYLEERKHILRNYPQMIEEKRIYHLGLDIIVPKGSSLYAPIDAIVHTVGLEKGIGNYGGYVILQHRLQDITFYTFYGHLNSNHIVKVGQKIHGGEKFGITGEREDSGGWFTHTHLQVITNEAKDRELMFQGYFKESDIINVDNLFPSPYPLFKY